VSDADPEVRRLSDALSEPLIKAYRLGGFGLAFLVLGAIFLAASAAAPRGSLSYVIAGVGLLLVVVPCYFFYVKEIRPIASAQATVRRESELIDSIQDTALELTLAAKELQSLALANAREVSELLRVARPAISRIPVLSRIAESPQFERADWFTDKVVVATGRSEQLIKDIRQALIEADAKQLRKYLDELRTLRVDLAKLLRTGAETSQPAADPSKGGFSSLAE
jgi:hypothetical protein